MAPNGQTAALPSPGDIPPNHNAGPGLVILTWCLFGLATFFFLCRLYSKIFKLKRFRLDDVFMLFAWLCSIPYCASMQLAYHAGGGRHYMYLTIPSTLELLKWLYIGQAFALMCPLLGRISFCFYLLAILGHAKRPRIRSAIWFFIGTQLAVNLGCIGALYADCGTNLEVIANPKTTCYHRGPLMVYSYFTGAWNSFTDAFLTFAPFLMIYGLNTTRRTKIIAISLLSLSSLALAASLWRVTVLEILFSRSLDLTYDAVHYFEAATLEQMIILITASVPALGPLFKQSRKSGNGSSSRFTNSASSSKRRSGDSGEIAYNLGHALGMHVPMLGNHVVITAGPAMHRSASEEEILPGTPPPVPYNPMAPLHVHETKRTDIKVEIVEPGEQYEMYPIRNRPR